MNTTQKTIQRERRRARIRAKISGTASCPRCAFFKSNTNVSAQLIDDSTGTTLLSASTNAFKKGTLTERAREAAQSLAKEAQKKNITEIVFDRGGFLYTGVVRTFADVLRENGLKF